MTTKFCYKIWRKTRIYLQRQNYILRWYWDEDRMKYIIQRCTKPGCGRSNPGSNPGILPNIVHKVKTQDGERCLLNWEQKELKKRKISCFQKKKFCSHLPNSLQIQTNLNHWIRKFLIKRVLGYHLDICHHVNHDSLLTAQGYYVQRGRYY